MNMKNDLIAYGLLLSLLCAGPNAFAADSANLTKAENLIRAQKYEEAYNLLEPEEFDQAGNLKYDYLLGLAALYSNRPDKATLVFERVLAVNPNYIGVRLDNGRAYYAMGDFARASQEFQTVLTQNPPADIRKQAQDYLAAMQKTTTPKKLSVTAYLEAGLGRDSNVTSANPSNPVILPGGNIPQTTDPNDPVIHRDNYLTWSLGSEFNYQFSDPFALFAGVDTRYHDYSKQNPSDYGTLDTRIGTAIGSGKFVTRITLNSGRYFQDRDSYRDSNGLNVDFRYQPNERNQASITTSAMRYRFKVRNPAVDPRGNDYNSYLASLGWLNVSASSRLISSFSINFGGEDTAPPDSIEAREDGNAKLVGVRYFSQFAFSDVTSAFFSTGMQTSHYKGVNSTLLGQREDKLLDAAVGLNFQFGKAWTLRPLLSWTRNKSNYTLVDFTKTDYSLSLRYDFR